MAHNLETRNGVVSFVAETDGPAPWHGLGKRVRGLTLEEAFKQGGLDYTVEKYPAYMMDPVTGEPVAVPEKFVTARTDGIPAQPLGVVGSKYHVVQNKASFNFLAPIIGDRAEADTAGVLGVGERAFITVRLPDFQFLPGDTGRLYGVFLNSHDGSSAVVCYATAVRTVCANTVAAGLKAATRKRAIRHTASAEESIKEAALAMGMVTDYATAMRNTAEFLAKVRVTDDQFTKMLGILWDGDSKRTENIKDEVRSIYRGRGRGIEQGTGWGALNAVTDYLSHKKSDAATGFLSLVEGSSAALQTEAVKFLQELAK